MRGAMRGAFVSLIPHTLRAALAQITSLGLSWESLEPSREEERSEMGLSSSVSVPK